MIKMSDSLGSINQEFAKPMTHELEQLATDSKVLSHLPFARSDKDSNNALQFSKHFHPHDFAIWKEVGFILILSNGQERMYVAW